MAFLSNKFPEANHVEWDAWDTVIIFGDRKTAVVQSMENTYGSIWLVPAPVPLQVIGIVFSSNLSGVQPMFSASFARKSQMFPSEIDDFPWENSSILVGFPGISQPATWANGKKIFHQEFMKQRWQFHQEKGLASPYLVGGIPTLLKNMSSSSGMIINNTWKHRHVPGKPPTR